MARAMSAGRCIGAAQGNPSSPTFQADVPQAQAQPCAFIAALNASPAAGLAHGGLRPAKAAASLHGASKIEKGAAPCQQSLPKGAGTAYNNVAPHLPHCRDEALARAASRLYG